MAASVALRRRVSRVALVVASFLAVPVALGTVADPADAAHKTYCGHTHSGGFDHETRPGDGRYYWTQFYSHYGPYYHVYLEWYHANGRNYYLGYYAVRCH